MVGGGRVTGKKTLPEDKGITQESRAERWPEKPDEMQVPKCSHEGS